MKAREPVFEKSRSVEDLDHMRLMALLRELVRDKGVREAAQALGVDHRTLASSLESGRLSRRMRVALEKALLEGSGSPAAEQRERNDEMQGRLGAVEGRVEELGRDMHKGLAAVQGDVKALRSEHAGGMRRLAQMEAGQGAQEVPEAAGAAGKPKRRPSLSREYPQLVTRELADDDEDVFGDAWALIVEWRELKDSHPNRGSSLSWLVTEERLLEVELALLEEHGLTLPPEKQPLRGLRPKRPGQLAKDRALRHAESAEKAGASAAGPNPGTLAEAAAFGVRQLITKVLLK